MTEDYKKEIAGFLDKTEHELKSAKALFDQNLYDTSVSCCYYAAFHITSALMIRCGYEFTKHRRLIGEFNRKFIHTGKVDKEYHKSLEWLFEIRHRGDYDHFVSIGSDEAMEAIKLAEQFVKEVKKLIGDLNE